MSDNPEQCSNYLKIIRLLVDVGTRTARDIFYHFKPRSKVPSFFGSTTICSELFDLKRRRIITERQYLKLISNPDPDEFDLSIILTLLTNIFTGMIDPPRNGWHGPLDKTDISLGADLIRLKELRNSTIGHSVNARIDSGDYEQLWNQIEDVLLRLNKHILGNNERDIKVLLENYKNNCLDPRQLDEKNHLDALQHWCKELREEVDDLWEKTKEFECFFEEVPDCYSRYVLLLNDGGKLVLEAVLKREGTKQSKDIKDLLQSNEEQLKEKIPNLNDMLQDIDQNTSQLNFHLWDISSMCFTASYLCKLSFLEKDAIRTIKHARENYADIALASLDADKFGSYWGDLKSSLYTLSSGQDDVVQIKCKALVEKYGKESIDKTATKKLLGQLSEGNGQLKRLRDAYKETCKRLKELAEDMERHGIPFKEEKVMTLKMITKGNREEKRKVAEDILYTVWQKALDVTCDSHEFPRVEKAVKNILDEIKAMDDVKLSSVTKHCVLLTFNCSSYSGLLSLITFIDSIKFKDHKLQVDSALTEHCNDYIHITGYVTLDSMQCDIKKSYENVKRADDNGIYLPISCRSISAVKHIQKLFEDGNVSNFENLVSHALSSETDEEIIVKSELDLEEFNFLFNPSKAFSDTADSDQTKYDEDKSTPTVKYQEYHTDEFSSEPKDDYVQSSLDVLTQKPVALASSYEQSHSFFGQVQDEKKRSCLSDEHFMSSKERADHLKSTVVKDVKDKGVHIDLETNPDMASKCSKRFKPLYSFLEDSNLYQLMENIHALNISSTEQIADNPPPYTTLPMETSETSSFNDANIMNKYSFVPICSPPPSYHASAIDIPNNEMHHEDYIRNDQYHPNNIRTATMRSRSFSQSYNELKDHQLKQGGREDTQQVSDIQRFSYGVRRTKSDPTSDRPRKGIDISVSESLTGPTALKYNPLNVDNSLQMFKLHNSRTGLFARHTSEIAEWQIKDLTKYQDLQTPEEGARIYCDSTVGPEGIFYMVNTVKDLKFDQGHRQDENAALAQIYDKHDQMCGDGGISQNVSLENKNRLLVSKTGKHRLSKSKRLFRRHSPPNVNKETKSDRPVQSEKPFR